jgi:hypothetical protein
VETASIASHAWPRAVNRVARPSLVALGETAAWLRLSPRQPVWRVDSASGPVTVVGDYPDFKQLDEVLATSLEVVPPEHARVGLWQLRSMIAEALARGEVCIAGLPRHLGTLLLPSAEVRFSLDAFVRHVVPLERVSDLRGRDHQGLRHALRHLDARHPVTRTSTSRGEFDHFHDALYVPHVRRRHREHALVSSRARQWNDWMQAGGQLLLIEVAGTLAAGGLVTLMGPRAMLVEEGLNEALADEPYFGALQGALKRAAIAWARSVGAKELSLGLSPAAAAHGIFKAKRLWGAIPEPARRPLAPTWTVMARHLPSDLRRLINSRRVAVFSDGRPCVLRVAGPDGTWEGADRSAADLRRDGFEAVLEAGHGPARVRPLEDAGAKV